MANQTATRTSCNPSAGRTSWTRILCLSILLIAICALNLQPSAAYARASGKGKREKFSGQIFDNPANGIGSWVIQIDTATQITISVSKDTRLDDGVLPIGASVRIEAYRQTNGQLLATRLRRDYVVAGQVVVRLQLGVAPETIATQYGLTLNSAVLSSGGIYLFNTANADGDVEALVDQMLLNANVIWAEPNFINSVPEGHPFKVWGWGGVDPTGYINQQSFAQVRLPDATSPFQGTGIDIAVLDTGIDLNHPAFVGRLVAGWDMVADDAIPQDEGPGLAWGHGTHVSGIIARVAPQSKIMPMRVLDSTGRSNTFVVAYAIERAAAMGAEVINLSLGSTSDSQILRDVVETVMGQGVLVVAAAGNVNSNIQHFPAANPGAIGVTALDSQNVKAPFANFGNGWVDVAAPGVGILSTMINTQGSGYATWSGTSMATPFVSGAAALLRQKYPTASAATIEQLLSSSGQAIDAQNPLYQGALGRLLDVQAALNSTLSVNLNLESDVLTIASVMPSARSAEQVSGSQQLFLPLVVN